MNTETMERNKYMYITMEMEFETYSKLVRRISKDAWMDSKVTIVNCAPEHSSILTQYTNHKLSYLNQDKLFDQVDLPIPYPGMGQVWNQELYEYQKFDTYITYWINKNIDPRSKYLFVSAVNYKGRNLNKLRLCLDQKIPNEQYKFATAYVSSTSLIKPDFKVKEFDPENGRPVFEWQNINNPDLKL